MSSDFLFVAPSFLRGLETVLDIGSTAESGNYSVSKTPTEADVRAMASDWVAVGQDIDDAVEAVKEEIAPK
jgi:hypothetical protein